MTSWLRWALVAMVLILAPALPSTVEAGEAGPLRRHPLVVLRALRQAVRRLVADPATILDCGVGPLPGDQSRNLRALRRAFGSATCESVDVHPFDGAAVARGRLPGLTILVRDLRMPGVAVDRFELRLSDVVVDLERLMTRGTLRLVGLGPVAFTAALEARRLAALVPAGWHLRVDEGGLVLEGRERLLWFPTAVRIEGGLEVEGGGRILFRTRRLNVGNLPFMALLRGRVTRRLNPLFDLDEYLGTGPGPLSLRIDDLRCVQGRVLVRGSGTLGCEPQSPRPDVR